MRRKTPLRARNSLENRLWADLRVIEGCRFRRKWWFRSFMLDFVEHDRGLAIALDDGEPGDRSSYGLRDRLLSEQGYVILRLWRWETERDLHSALHRIRMVLEDLADASSA